MRKKIIRYILNNHRQLFWKLKRVSNNTIVKDEAFIKLYGEVLNENRCLMTMEEIFNLYKLIKESEKIHGDIAEVGVYRGGSARVIAELKGRKTLHLYDTFEGMPEVKKQIDKHLSGDFDDTSLEDVKRYLSVYDYISFHKGDFRDTSKRHGDTVFSFVNIDVDIYDSTFEALSFFYPRLSRCGMILSHDYRSITCPGVKKAFDVFFADKPEPVIELWSTQCLVVKM